MQSPAHRSDDVPPRATRREWLGLAVLALPCLLITMDLTVLFLAVPQLADDLSPSATELLWITDAYGFLLAGALIVMGTLGDRVGRRRLILAGAGAFGATSLLAAAASSPEMLIVARALQGIAGATLLPSTMALVFTMFRDEQQRTAALGIVMASFALGAVLGPLLGGAVLQSLDWSAVFLLNVPVMALLLVLGRRLLPEARNAAAGQVDVTSAALSVAAVLATIYGVKELAQDGAGPVALGALAGGVALAAAFIARQLRLDEPLVDVRLFARRAFATAFAANALAMFATYGMVFFTSQHLQLVLGLSPLEAGLWGLPPALAMMVAAGAVVPKLAARVRPAFLIAGGLVVAATGLTLLTGVEPDDGALRLAAPMVLAVVGLAPATTLGIGLIVGVAPPERAGSVSGLADAGNELAGALGIAVLGTIGTAVYREQLAGSAPDTLGAAAGLPADAFAAASEAFTDGMHVAVGAGAALLLAAAAAVAVLLRDVRAPSTQAPPAGAQAPVPPVQAVAA